MDARTHRQATEDSAISQESAIPLDYASPVSISQRPAITDEALLPTLRWIFLAAFAFPLFLGTVYIVFRLLLDGGRSAGH